MFVRVKIKKGNIKLLLSGFNILEIVNLLQKKPEKCSNIAADSVAPNQSAN